MSQVLPDDSLASQGSSSSTIDEIRNIVTRLMARCHVPYAVMPLDDDFYEACYLDAVRRGCPMENLPHIRSYRPFIAMGAIMGMTAYAHLENTSTKIFIAQYTSLLIYLEDTFNNDPELVSSFNNKFITMKPHGHPAFNALAQLLREFPLHFGSVASNMILTSTLNFVTSICIEEKVDGLEVTGHTRDFPSYLRRLTGTADSYAIFSFPPDVPFESYIMAIPSMSDYINYTNDVCSFYKEEVGGETNNYVSTLARCHNVPRIQALSQLADVVAERYETAADILSPHQRAHECFIRLVHGYYYFHTSLDRYRMDELMGLFQTSKF